MKRMILLLMVALCGQIFADNAPVAFLGIGPPAPGAPQSSSGTVTAQSYTGNVNNYFEVNVQNLSSGSSASSDFTATANDGTATTHYANFGINSSGGGGAPFTNAHAAYLYGTDLELDIGANLNGIGGTPIMNFYMGVTPNLVGQNSGSTLASGTHTIFYSTASTTTGTGALVVNGGEGLAGALYAGGLINGAGGLTVKTPIAFQDATDATKQVAWTISNQSTATTVTINTGAQTVNRQINLPVLGGTDTLSTLAVANAFTGANTMSGTLISSNGTAANAAGTAGAIYCNNGGISSLGAMVSQLGFGVGALPTGNVPILASIAQNSDTQFRATNAGATAAASCTMAVNNGTHAGLMTLYGTAFTTSGATVQDGMQLGCTGAGGITINASNAAGIVTVWTNGVQRGQVSSSGVWTLGPTSNPGANTFAPPIIYGRNNAAADNLGAVGENITATNTSAYTNFTTTAIYQQIASIPLTAGKWHIFATGTFNSAGATITAGTNTIWAISNTTASAAGITEGSGDIFYWPAAVLTLLTNKASVNLDKIINISASATWYLNAQATWTAGGPPQFVGSIRADRMP